jgi:hypothetical protein
LQILLGRQLGIGREASGLDPLTQLFRDLTVHRSCHPASGMLLEIASADLMTGIIPFIQAIQLIGSSHSRSVSRRGWPVLLRGWYGWYD